LDKNRTDALIERNELRGCR